MVSPVCDLQVNGSDVDLAKSFWISLHISACFNAVKIWSVCYIPSADSNISKGQGLWIF